MSCFISHHFKGVYNDMLELVTFRLINALPSILCCHGCVKRRMSYMKHFYSCKLKRHNISHSLVKHFTSSWQYTKLLYCMYWYWCVHKAHQWPRLIINVAGRKLPLQCSMMSCTCWDPDFPNDHPILLTSCDLYPQTGRGGAKLFVHFLHLKPPIL